MHADYIIVGQGLCGTWLSYYLLAAGASVAVFEAGKSSASAAASGIINPITGKRLARQWMHETILPFAAQAYDSISTELGMPLAATIPIHSFFNNEEEASFFEQKAASTHDDLLSYKGSIADAAYFNFHYGVGSIYLAMLVDVRALLSGWRTRLEADNLLREAPFDWQACTLESSFVSYQNVQAKALIDCSGAVAAGNPFFDRLPFALNKGEALIASIPGLPRDAIYKFDTISIVPWREDRFWIGSTFDWDFKDELPTSAFRQKAEWTLRQWLRLPFTIHEHFAAIRPATVSRDAFAGMHPAHPQIGALNGMGSKGCSLAPFLAHNLAQHLVHGTSLLPNVDIIRYARTLNR